MAFTKLTNPAILPTGAGNGCAFSPDGKYVAVAHATSPFITIYSFSGGVLTKLANPSSLPTATCYRCTFSPNSTFLVVSISASPYIAIYSINSSGVFTKIANPATLPTGSAFGCKFSPSGNFLAVTHNTSPYVTIYSVSGNVFTKVANPATLPTGAGRNCAFSPDGTLLAVIGSGFVIYSISGSVFTAIDTSSLPKFTGNSCAFSPDGKYLAAGSGNNALVSISEGVFTALPDLTGRGSGSISSASFSFDSTFLAIATSGSPFTEIYSISSSGVFTRQADLSPIQQSTVNECSFSYTGMYLAIAYYISPYILVYNNEVNRLPVIENLAADIYSIHNDSITISFTATDADGDSLTYQISINGSVYEAYKAYVGVVSVTIPASNFIVGTNSIIVSVTDGSAIVTGELFITRMNTAPVLTGTLDKQVFHGVIGDAENDTIRWRALLNGAVLYDWSSYEASPVSIDFTLTASQVQIGAANVLRMEYEDDLGLAGNAEFDFVGVDYSERKKVLLPFIM